MTTLLNGRDAIDMLCAKDIGSRVDVCLLDLCMPEVDGYEVLQRVRCATILCAQLGGAVFSAPTTCQCAFLARCATTLRIRRQLRTQTTCRDSRKADACRMNLLRCCDHVMSLPSGAPEACSFSHCALCTMLLKAARGPWYRRATWTYRAIRHMHIERIPFGLRVCIWPEHS